ncbi:hypothetical protein [Brucella sp. JSBI001]|uniref:hypothetical protein n=1 Tax=Brucella sp. JSBI001 TaxID=2886044 RepID=UPI00222F1B42|nr:hypothetical protein [Brucella sp. JSBI001]UZD69116.1 hypothetical protein LJ361_18670 [Brucella sp. JSBI001]
MSFKLSKAKMKCPKWMKRADFNRILQMDTEEALDEVERLKNELREYKRKWREENREKYREYKREYVRQWRKKNPKKAKEIDKRKQDKIRGDPVLLERARQLRRESRARTGIYTNKNERAIRMRRYYRNKSLKMARERPNELRALIRPMVPGYLDPSAKMDVIAAVMEMALKNRVEFNKLNEAVKAAVTAYNRQFDQFKNVSIDAPIAGTDGLTRADLLDSETFHF